MKASQHRLAHRLTLLAIPAALTACGGGGSETPAPVPQTPVATTLALTGTAATGAAMANAKVDVKCATGSTTATADANGKFSVSITNGALPCVLTATSGSTELHSVAAGTGNAATTANITPLSELLIAQLEGTDPKTYIANFGATTAIDPKQVTDAQTALLATLKSAGIDTSKVDNIVSGAIAIGSGGNSYDGVLDTLKNTLAGAGTTLAELTTAVSTTNKSGGATGGATIGTVLAQAPQQDCPGLKTGALRVVNFNTTDPALASYRVNVDAAALTATIGGTSYKLAKSAACDYTVSAVGIPTTRVLVAHSGMAVLLQSGGVAGVAIPDQQLDVSALAGRYNRVNYGKNFDTFIGDFGVTTFNAAGLNTKDGVYNCPLGYGQCTADGQDKGSLVVNPAGGFDYVEPTGAHTTRLFAFRNAAGRTFALGWDKDGTVTVATSQDKLTLPAVGRVANFWQFNVRPATGMSAVTEDSNTVTKVDAAAGTATRQFSSVTNDGHFDTLAYNPVEPTGSLVNFTGARYRDPKLCTDAQGAAYTRCSSTVQLPFGGVVVTVSTVSSNRFIAVSIDKP